MKTNKQWVDASGNIVPAAMITPLDKKKESYADRIRKKAERASKLLSDLKMIVEAASDDLYARIMKKKGLKISDRKGNYTWYNFDKSIKVEIDISERQVFDSFLIDACKCKLMNFLESEISSEDEFIKQLVLDAFETKGGKLDTKRVTSLLKYREKIRHQLYQDAMVYLEKAIDRQFVKKYSKVYVRNESTLEYEAIPLNYSDVKVS